MSGSEACRGVAGQRAGASSYCVKLDHSLLASRCCLPSAPHTCVAIRSLSHSCASSLTLSVSHQVSNGAACKGQKGRKGREGRREGELDTGGGRKGRERQEGGRGRGLGRLRGAREGGCQFRGEGCSRTGAGFETQTAAPGVPCSWPSLLPRLRITNSPSLRINLTSQAY